MSKHDRAVLYGRLSQARTDETGKRDDSNVDSQLELAREHAERLGMTVVAEHRDDSISAYRKADREGFIAVLDCLERGDADVVIVRDLDRLLRARKDTARFLDIGQSRGVLISTYRGQSFDLSTAAGTLLAEVIASVGAMESGAKAERLRDMHVRRRAEGKPWGPYRIFGLNKDGTLHPEEAPLVQKAVEDILDNRSMRSIAAEWNEQGVQTTRQGQWRQSTLSNYVKNPRIAGLMPDGVSPGKWEAIIDPRTFALLQQHLSDPSRSFGHQQRNGRGRSDRLLAGVASDPHGRVIGTGKSSSGGYVVYRSRTVDDQSAVGKVSRKAETCDEEIISEVLSLISSPMLNIVEGQSAADREKLAEVHGKLAELAQERTELAEAGLGVAAYAAYSKALDKRELELKGELGEVKRSGRYADLNLEQMPYSRNKETLRAWWDGLSVQEQRAELDRWFESITILPGRGRATDAVLRQSILDEARQQGLM